MNFKNKIILILAFTLGLTSCSDYLSVDKYFDDALTLETTFKKREYAEGFLSNAYEVMWAEVCDISVEEGNDDGWSHSWAGSVLFASDELLRMNNLCKRFQNAEYSSENPAGADRPIGDKWKRVFETVRKATTIIKYADICEEMTIAERTDMKAQAYFLRGYAYWVLLRQYGPLTLIPEGGFNVGMTYAEMAVPRNTWDECVDAIESDFLAAARLLQPKRSSDNIGRPTQGAALAARARLLLFSASPLYNDNNSLLWELKDDKNKRLMPEEYHEYKWARAAAAALDVINLDKYALYTVPATAATVQPPHHAEYSEQDFPNGWKNIDPFESYRQIFNGAVTSSKNPEVIFTRPNDDKGGITDLNQMQMPISLTGDNAIAVTLAQVNAYVMNDGRTIDEAAATGDYPMTITKDDFTASTTEYPHLGRGVCLQYANREPRFYASIAYPGSIWECGNSSEASFKNAQVFYYSGTPNGKGSNVEEHYLITGIGLKKYYHPDDYPGHWMEKFEPAIRYAEVLLWYAEAINELTQTHEVETYNGVKFNISRSTAEMQRGMK
ncbi:MAG: RagB/SusD family nutrient uptake outer membrane protein, partial [Candidatus Symbiothrix sp.]|nr:RagB/SusD family nutrient uptake outer membrane protein [Candidatus Symbiothrix sp.]